MLSILRFIVIMVLAILLLFASVIVLVRLSGGAPPPTEEQKVDGRKIYSPDIRHDPYVREQWEVSVHAFEEECRRTKRFCIEAKNAREAMDKLDEARVTR